MAEPHGVLVQAIRPALAAVADPTKAAPMQAYMRSEMPFRGVQKPDRVKALRPVFSAHELPDRDTWTATVRALWDNASYREERYAAICQVGARTATDTNLLADSIVANAADADFFLRKAIGWALREHAKTDPSRVRDFVAMHRDRLSSLSVREATRNLQQV